MIGRFILGVTWLTIVGLVVLYGILCELREMYGSKKNDN